MAQSLKYAYIMSKNLGAELFKYTLFFNILG